MPKKKKGKKKAKAAPVAPSTGGNTKAKVPAKTSQVLPSREKNLFDLVIKNYDSKNYKKCIKLCDQILKRVPDNGETLAMKGLAFGVGLNKKEEGFELTKLGLRHNMKSHVCWHVYGLLHRAEFNYEQAMKCYQNALRIQNTNQNILRDLALLQVQLGSYEKLCESRRQMLSHKPGYKANWVGFAVAHHLSRHYDVALGVIDQYLETLEKSRKPDYADSELTMLRALILEEKGDYENALLCLQDNDSLVRDRESFLRKRGELLLRVGKFREAARDFLRLVRSNPENYEFHRGIHAAVFEQNEIVVGGCSFPCEDSDANDARLEKLKNLYFKWDKEFPKTNACQRIPLSFLPTPEYMVAVERYIKSRVKRGVPSLFSDIKPTFCLDKERSEGVVKIADAIVQQLRTDLTFPGETDAKKMNPQVFVWAIIFAAKCHDLVGDYDGAISLVKDGIEHTPTILELYQLKGHIQKHMGDQEGAVESLNHAREIDLQDRYINTKHVKYLMRHNRVEEAHETAGLFTKHENDPVAQVYYMQVMWQELEEADSHSREKNFAMALRRYNDIHKHFHEFWDNQFDFHMYCLRKTTIRSYLGMLRLTNQKCKDKFFQRAAIGKARVYLEIGKLSAEEKAPLVKRFAAEEQETIKKIEKEKEEKEKEGKTPDERDEKRNEDLNGNKLFAVNDPLGEAWKLVEELMPMNVDQTQVHELAFDVASALKKPLLQLKALLQLHRIDQLSCGTVRRTNIFVTETSKAGEEYDSTTSQMLTDRCAALLKDAGGDFEKYASRFADSLSNKTYHALRKMCKNNGLERFGKSRSELQDILVASVKSML